MKTLLMGLLLVGSLVADERSLWLLDATNVPGVPETSTPATLYGVQVFCGSDNPLVTGWQVQVTVRMSDGQEQTFSGFLVRTDAYPDMPFSDAVVFWVSSDLDWTVLQYSAVPQV